MNENYLAVIFKRENKLHTLNEKKTLKRGRKREKKQKQFCRNCIDWKLVLNETKKKNILSV